jgi:arabinofuranosyltransferase
MRSISIGLILYLLYFLKSGGDFMQGRFFAVPSFIATFSIVAYLVKRNIPIVLYFVVAIVIYITANVNSPLFVGKAYSIGKIQMGVADERGFYFQRYGLISPNRKWPKIVTLDKHIPSYIKIICGGLGASGLKSRNETFHIDQCALTDPLLSQLPATAKQSWRIGHQARKIPTNYGLAVIDESIHLEDQKLDLLYQDVKRVSHGALFDKNRLKSIYRLNSKNYDIDSTLYKDPNIKLKIYGSEDLYSLLAGKRPKIIISEKDLPNKITPGVIWNAKQCQQFSNDGISIIFSHKAEANKIRIGLDNNDEYVVLFYNNGKMIEAHSLKAKVLKVGGLSTREIEFSQKITFEKIDIFPLEGDTAYSIGYINYE